MNCVLQTMSLTGFSQFTIPLTSTTNYQPIKILYEIIMGEVTK